MPNLPQLYLILRSIFSHFADTRSKRLKLTANIGLTLLVVESDYLIAAAVVVENMQQMKTISAQN